MAHMSLEWRKGPVAVPCSDTRRMQQRIRSKSDTTSRASKAPTSKPTTCQPQAPSLPYTDPKPAYNPNLPYTNPKLTLYQPSTPYTNPEHLVPTSSLPYVNFKPLSLPCTTQTHLTPTPNYTSPRLLHLPCTNPSPPYVSPPKPRPRRHVVGRLGPAEWARGVLIQGLHALEGAPRVGERWVLWSSWRLGCASWQRMAFLLLFSDVFAQFWVLGRGCQVDGCRFEVWFLF